MFSRLPAALQYCQQSRSVHIRIGIAGVLHNDLKPENIFLAKKPNLTPDSLVIGDLGLANTIRHYKDNWDEAGTPGWMAPEANGTYTVHSSKTDVFSLGAILHFMVTGSPPFKSDLGTSCFSLRVLFGPTNCWDVQLLCMHILDKCQLLSRFW